MFQSMLISSRVFRETGGLDENIVSYQEWDTAIQLSKKGLFGYVEEPTFIYDCTGVDTISKDGLRGAEGYSQIVSKHFFQILFNLGPRAISQHYHYIASRHRLAGDVLTARIFKRKAVAWWPSPPLVIRHFSTILKRTVLPKNRGLR
jgi:GT2 family glycosyltransferase